jgi:hypothetical protein
VYQQHVASLPVAVLVLDAPSNELHHLLPLVPMLEAALAQLQARTLLTIKLPP